MAADADAFPATELDAASELLRSLLRLDTSNPPGNERPAVDLVDAWCRDIGLATDLVGATAERPNLVARWTADPARRNARPLVLSCHLDTVPAEPARWTHPPFSGHDDGECLWGRGAVDMKGFAAMGLAALARLKNEDLPLRRDVIFAAVCDEEAGTRHGSRWLVDERPDLLGGNPEYVINEVGGFTVHRNGERFYPVQVAEKGVAWLRLTVRGKPGHSSLPATDTAVTRLAAAVRAIARARLPWHPGPEAAAFIDGFAAAESRLARSLSSLLSHPAIGPCLLPLAVRNPSRRASLEAVLRNTANPTRLQGGPIVNALPGSASVDIDGRLAPGQTAADLVAELEAVVAPILGDHGAFTVLQESAPTSFPADTRLYREIEATLIEADPGCRVVPAIIPGFTDSHNYARLGAHCYGFYPLRLPPDLDFAALFHGDDERIPVDGFHWGIRTLTHLLRRFLTTDH